MQEKAQKLTDLLPRGSQSKIAETLGVSRQAVGDALKRCKPGNPVVIEAMRIARECGALDVARDLAKLAA
jgi:DNA-binding transcriptional regulator LsrR (DeoR family)